MPLTIAKLILMFLNSQDTLLSQVMLQVDEGMSMVHREKCDCIISFGGGSPHDAAKGIAVLATNGGISLPTLHPTFATILLHLQY